MKSIKIYKIKIAVFLIILVFASLGFYSFGLTHDQGWSNPASENQPLAGDAGQYNAYAKNLTLRGFYGMGESFDNFREPGYPLFLSLIYKIFGLFNFGAVRFIQLLLLALSGYFVYLIFSTYQRDKFGLLAGVLTVLIPYYGYYAVELTTELLFAFLIIFSFYLVIKIIKSEKSGLAPYLGLGAVLGYASLVRAQILFFPLFLLIIFFLAGRNKKFEHIKIKKIIAGLAVFFIMVSGWTAYAHSKTGHFGLTESRQEQLIYYRAVRSELSFKELTTYLSDWLKRSATNGKTSDSLDKYDFKNLYNEYYEKATSPSKIIEIRNQSIKTIIHHPDKYLAGSVVEFIKLTFIEHTYAGSYNKYLRAGFYLVLYAFFLFSTIKYVFCKKKSFRLIFLLSFAYLIYNYLIITVFDAVPRYNTPYLAFYLLIGLIGLMPEKSVQKIQNHRSSAGL